MEAAGRVVSASQILFDELFRVREVVHGVYNVIANVNSGVGKACVLPVDENYIPVRQEHPVGAVGIAVAEAFFHAVAQRHLIESADFCFQRFVGSEAVGVFSGKQLLHTQRVLPWAHSVVHFHVRSMELPQDRQHLFGIRKASVVRLPELGNKPGDLPPLVDVGVDVCRVDAQLLRLYEGSLLVAAVDDAVGAVPRVAVDVVHTVDLKNKGCVGHALADVPEVHDIFLVAAENQLDVPDDAAVGVAQVLGVKLAKLLEIVKLEDRAGGVFLIIHGRQLGKVVLHQPLPEAGVIAADLPVGFGKGDKGVGEFFSPEGMPQQHAPRVPVFCHPDDFPVAVRIHVQFVHRFADGQTGVKGLVFKAVKGILHKIAVTDADVGVFQLASGEVQAFNVVFDVERVVDDEFDAVLLLQIEEHFLFVAQNHRDVVDSGVLQLLDLTLDQPFSLDLEQSLWLL